VTTINHTVCADQLSPDAVVLRIYRWPPLAPEACRLGEREHSRVILGARPVAQLEPALRNVRLGSAAAAASSVKRLVVAALSGFPNLCAVRPCRNSLKPLWNTA
jgi:hypothetical protein